MGGFRAFVRACVCVHVRAPVCVCVCVLLLLLLLLLFGVCVLGDVGGVISDTTF